MFNSKKAGAAKAPKTTGKKLPAVPESILKRRKKHEVSQQLKLKQAIRVSIKSCNYCLIIVLMRDSLKRDNAFVKK